jgi:hypothetical protein
VVSSARTDKVLKVIVANPIMIEAYKGGIPNNAAVKAKDYIFHPYQKRRTPCNFAGKRKSLGNGHGAIWPCPPSNYRP